MRPRIVLVWLALFACCLFAPAQANDLSKEIPLKARSAIVTVDFPGEEQRVWAHAVAAFAVDGLPKLEEAAGFVCPLEKFTISYAADAAASGGLEARWQGEGKVAVRMKFGNGTAHGHAVLCALAHAWSEKVAAEPWAQEALAHFYVWKALRDLPRIYDARTYRDELVQEAAKAGESPLDGWKPPAAAADRTGAYPYAFAQGARGMLFLCCVERHFGEGLVAKVSNALSSVKPATTAELAAAVTQQAGKPAEDYFFGWAMPVLDKEKQKPALKTLDIHDDDDDSLLNFEETEVGTDPKNPDTDGDGLSDGEEVFDTHTDPKAADAKKPAITIDGDPKDWMRVKKLTIQDPKTAAKDGTKGAALRRLDLCADDRFLYVRLDADSLANGEVSYNFAFDVNDDEKFDYYFGFRTDRQRWVADTHGTGDLSWAEYKNYRGIMIRVKDNTAEARIPLAAIGGAKKLTVLVYTTKAGAPGTLCALPRTKVDLDKYRQ
jgi:hypothetical protein